MNIIFQNWCGNGDLHLGREFIKDIINKLPNNTYNYCHRQSKRLFLDIPQLNQNYSYDLLKSKIGNQYFNVTFQILGNDCFINTWIGQRSMEFVKKSGTSLHGYYALFKEIYHHLGIDMKDIFEYIPTIDYSFYNLNDVNKYLENTNRRKILICNGQHLSGQFVEVNFNPVIDRLSEENKDVDFILTDDKKRISKENVLYTSDIIKNGNEGDLNEISFLSTKCEMIVGKSSGPQVVSMVKENLYRELKMISFTFPRNYAILYEDNTKCSWICYTNFQQDIYQAIKENM